MKFLPALTVWMISHLVSGFSRLRCCISGDGNCVSKQSGCAARRSLVDHTGGGSGRNPDFGFDGVSALEGGYTDFTLFYNPCIIK